VESNEDSGGYPAAKRIEGTRRIERDVHDDSKIRREDHSVI